MVGVRYTYSNSVHALVLPRDFVLVTAIVKPSVVVVVVLNLKKANLLDPSIRLSGESEEWQV